MINNFHGKYSFLSNFHPVRIVYASIVYPTVEHAYQASKTLLESERRYIASCSTAGKAKKAGKEVRLRKDWEEAKLPIMTELVRRKFSKNLELEEKLLATGDEKLIEGNTWGDTFWGVYNDVGKNHLGKILMKIRKELKIT